MHRKKDYGTAILFIALVTAGCAPEHREAQPRKSQIRFFEGKRYALPIDASKSAHIGTKEEIAFFRKSGIKDCRNGDVIWDTEGTQEQIAQAIRLGDARIHRKLAQEGRIGCAHPIAR